MELERIAAPAAQALEAVSGIDVPRFVASGVDVDPRRPGRAAGIAHRVPGVVSIVRSERGRRRDVARVGITHARLHAAYAALTR